MLYYLFRFGTAGREKMEKETYSAEETFNFGKKLGENAESGGIYALTGDLGVG